MTIVRCKKAGFCFGVSQIDQKVEQALQQEKKVFSYGALVHNPRYVAQREQQGLRVLENLEEAKDRLDADSLVVLRAHGVTKQERDALRATGATLIDGTCPVLLGIYKLGRKKNEEGFRIVIIGDPCHPEIRAMRSYFREDTAVLHTLPEARAFRSEVPVFILSQTTNRPVYFEEMAREVLAHNEGLSRSTICHATAERQQAVLDLQGKIDALLVVGGENSSNTEKLAQVGRSITENVYKITGFADLPLQKLQKFNRIGLTAGASTPDWIIEEVVTGMDNFSSKDFMEQIEDSFVKIYPKDIVKGTVISVKDDEVFVDIRFRADGIVKSDEMTDEEKADTHAAFHENDEIDVYVIKLDDGEGNVVLSTRRVEGLRNWQKLVEHYEANETVEAKVLGDNSGGLVVSVFDINGFMPASQITTHYVKNLKKYIGQTMECKIISIDERKRRVVLSRRVLKDEELDAVWETIVPGERVKGKVVRMTDFGAFVDLGGVDGLIHVSDISWERIAKPSDALEVGQEVEPVVLKANRERNRISLGLKQLMPKPFDVFVENNKKGDVVQGKVMNLLDFGAFVRLKEGVEGLVHVSQIASHHVEKPSDELNMGDEITVKIIDIDVERQRIALSIRALQEPEEEKDKEKETGSAELPRRKRDDSRFERRPKPEQRKAAAPKQPRERRETHRESFSFDSGDDIGTNLGDLISAKLGALDQMDLPEAPETPEEPKIEEQAPVAQEAVSEEAPSVEEQPEAPSDSEEE